MERSKFVIEAFCKVTSKKEPQPNELAALESAEFIQSFNDWKNATDRFNKFRTAMHNKYSQGGSKEFYNIKPNSGGKYHVPVYCDVDMGMAFVETTKEEADLYVVMDEQRVASMKNMQKLENDLKNQNKLWFSLVNVHTMADRLEAEHKAMLARMNPQAPLVQQASAQQPVNHH